MKWKDYKPSFGHAEQASLRSFSKRMSIDPEAALAELRKNGLVVEDLSKSLEAIARKNKKTPLDIYIIIKKLENMPVTPAENQPEAGEKTATAAAKTNLAALDTKTQDKKTAPAVAVTPPPSKKLIYTEEMITTRFEGKGTGKKTLQEVCTEIGVDLQRALAKLKAKNYIMKPEETMREAATRYETGPMDLLVVILLGEEVK